MQLVAPLENHFPLLYAILKDHISDDVNYKVFLASFNSSSKKPGQMLWLTCVRYE